MRAIELSGNADRKGFLHHDNILSIKEKKVKAIVLAEEDTAADEKIWMESVLSRHTFDFLKSPAEDIYSLKDGNPSHGKR